MIWQPIGTAPKDGVRFLGLTWDGVIKQGYQADDWFFADGSISVQKYTHWMPLPEPPK